jgi:hypothetical protein
VFTENLFRECAVKERDEITITFCITVEHNDVYCPLFRNATFRPLL